MGHRTCRTACRISLPLTAVGYFFLWGLVAAASRLGLAHGFAADPETRRAESPHDYYYNYAGTSLTKSSNNRRHSEDALPSTALAMALSASMDSMEPLRPRPTAVEKPPVTETATPLPELDKTPVNHKIVVLGATGKVGRLLVRQLLEDSPDGTQVVAVVRDYDKACRVLYDDLIVMKQERKGPKLQIVAAELVSRSEMPAAASLNHVDDDDDEEDDTEWLKRAQAAARFYGTKVSDYDDGRVTDDENACALEQIMQGCTAIVSCVGAVRPSKPWQDWWLTRLLRKDVRKWCADPKHPYYTHYYITRKILRLAEREQERRNVLFQAQDEADEENSESELLRRRRDKNAPPRRIRFVRLSDLGVTQKPWHLVPVLTNALRSMVFRYHEMADDLVARSRLLDTVIVRAGDLVDDERDDDEVGVQVQVDDYQFQNATGAFFLQEQQNEHAFSNRQSSCDWSPARVGREDVAALLSASALAPWLAADNQTASVVASVHYALAVRWSGDAHAMAPYPAQGKKTYGCRTAAKSLQKAVRKRQRKGHTCTVATTTLSRFKPYGLCVAIPLYFTLALLIRNLSKTIVLASQGTRLVSGVLPVAFLPNLRPFWQAMMRFFFRKAPAVQYISF